MRNTPLKGLMRKSPLEKNKGFDYSKKADYSKEATKDNFGSKLAKAITPENTPVGVATSMLPIGKAGKFLKTAYNYFKG